MMYATLTYYRSTYIGQAVSDDTKLTQLLTRASADMDAATLGRIDTTEMNSVALDYLSRATCAQAERYAMEGLGDVSGSVSLGSFSMSGKEGSAPGGISANAAKYLALTGLMNRAVYSSPRRNLDELERGGVIPKRNGE